LNDGLFDFPNAHNLDTHPLDPQPSEEPLTLFAGVPLPDIPGILLVFKTGMPQGTLGAAIVSALTRQQTQH
jgi:hypothetical protein